MLQHYQAMIEGRVVRYIHVYAKNLGDAIDKALPKHYMESFERVEIILTREN